MHGQHEKVRAGGGRVYRLHVLWLSAFSILVLIFIALMCFEVFFLAVLTWLAHPVLNELTWWAILAN